MDSRNQFYLQGGVYLENDTWPCCFVNPNPKKFLPIRGHHDLLSIKSYDFELNYEIDQNTQNHQNIQVISHLVKYSELHLKDRTK